MCYALFILAATLPHSAAVSLYPSGADINGVALNGLLQLEDWFFSWPEGLPPVTPFPFDEVASGPTLPQGK